LSSAASSPVNASSTSSTVTAGIDFRKAPTFFLLRRAQSLAGIIFGLYLMVHLLVNATLIQGAPAAGEPTVYQVQVDKIHSLPFLLGIELTAIFLPLLIHTLYGIYVIVQGKPNSIQYGYIKNWFYTMQRVTAVLLVAFIFFHVGAMYGWFGSGLKFNHHDASNSAIHHLHSSFLLWGLIYPIGILCATFHLANGFWTGAISWGLTVSAKAQNRWGWVCLAIFLFTTLCGFLALLGTFTYHPLPAVVGTGL